MQKELKPEDILQNSSLVFSEQEVDSAIQQIADKIQCHVGSSAIVLMCVMTGGLYFCAKLMAKLTMPIELDYVQANRYQHDLRGGSLIWTKSPSINLKNKIVVIIDDILDEGITLNGVKASCQQLGASQVLTAVLAEKNNHLNKAISADFIGLSVPNKFVFGCGMDAYGWWRNLPEIRSLS